jgi:DDE superfamily endonuclease
VGGKRLRVEALLAAAASPLPPPVDALVPDPTLADLLPADLPALLALLPGADLYLQDEVEVALHPTLTRVWSRRGRRGQRLVEAPGTNTKRYGFGLVDWRDGWLDWALAEGRRAAPFCAQLRRALARSAARERTAIVLLDNLSIHTPRGSKLLRALVAEAGARLVLVYTPRYDPDANRIESRASFYRDSRCGAARARPYHRRTPGASARRAEPSRGATLPRAGRAALGGRIAGREPAVCPRFLVYAPGAALGAARDGRSDAQRRRRGSRASAVPAQP